MHVGKTERVAKKAVAFLLRGGDNAGLQQLVWQGARLGSVKLELADATEDAEEKQELVDNLVRSENAKMTTIEECRTALRAHGQAAEAQRARAEAQSACIAQLEAAVTDRDATVEAQQHARAEAQSARVAHDGAAADNDANAQLMTASAPGDLVKLNVGGARFEASRAVLTKVEDSMLERMFGRCDAMLEADPLDGSNFIDRDGDLFGTILDFLRGDPPDGPRMQRTIRALPEAVQEALVQELNYFGLATAVFGERPWTDDAAFRPGPAMGSVRSFCAAVSAGGRVVVFGGVSGRSALDSTLLLDTQTMTFTAGPNMLTERYGCAVDQIDADRLLLLGGNNGGGYLNTTEIFNLSTLTLTPGPNMQVLIVGGYDGASYLSTTEIFTLDMMAFAPGPTMAFPRYGCAAIALDEHRIMVIGGELSREQSLQTTEVLDVRTMAFAPGPPMGSARCFCTAVPVDAQHVLVIGGRDSANTPLATTELLDPFDSMLRKDPR
ncbi:hypothetical protein M885DRAFT_564088 [Pelagophyceae sp. CCMP2097]|nr:hypothetical protein M885DRAFT_564088 [Pelagophyceae sp. CCMP2097]